MKFGIAVDKDRGEYSVYRIDDEQRARDAIASHQAGRKIEIKTIDANDMAAAEREAEKLYPHHHHVIDTLKGGFNAGPAE